jgi:hypothetical protein
MLACVRGALARETARARLVRAFQRIRWRSANALRRDALVLATIVRGPSSVDIRSNI